MINMLNNANVNVLRKSSEINSTVIIKIWHDIEILKNTHLGEESSVFVPNLKF